MIEVEKKFRLNEGDTARLIAGAEFVGEKTMRDVYYDAPGYPLTQKDWWLRLRDGVWELKISQLAPGEGKTKNEGVDQYEEVTDEREIARRLGLAGDETLAKTLSASGYVPFATIVTTRKKYRSGKFVLDIDAMDYGYDLAEVELMVPSESEMPDAVREILSFAEQRGLTVAPVRGKVIEYIVRNNPEQYRVICEAWGIEP